MVSRALGDALARQIGVSCEPAVFAATNLGFVVLASDGLWEVMTSEEVLLFVARHLASALPLSELLCHEAQKRWMVLESKVGDDVSCVVLVMEE
jgi:serine/threonine protein phosphatase PrpC